MAEITLRKYHGLGNDYLIYDPNRNACELQERQVEALCRRNLGCLLYTSPSPRD